MSERRRLTVGVMGTRLVPRGGKGKAEGADEAKKGWDSYDG